jgi:hypothetical protein
VLLGESVSIHGVPNINRPLLTVGDVLDSELNKNMSKNSEKMGKKYSRVGGYIVRVTSGNKTKQET